MLPSLTTLVGVQNKIFSKCLGFNAMWWFLQMLKDFSFNRAIGKEIAVERFSQKD